MHWSIRSQILVPLIAIQVIAVTAATVTTATLAARRTEREIIDRLHDVVATLERGNIPHTASVFRKMRGLSGAHFVTGTREGQLAETSLPALTEFPASLRALAPTSRISSLWEITPVLVAGTRYFAVRAFAPLEPQSGPLVVLYPESSWRLARREAALPPLLVGAGSLGAMILATSWIAARISSRVGRVNEQVSAIAAGDFRELEVHNGRDEVDELMLSINRMCGQLKEMRQRIHRSERASLLAQLAAGLAHQLRNSLTGARMSIQLHTQRYPPPKDDRTLEVALRQLELTEEQVRGLLAAGRVEQRAVEICDAHSIIDEVAVLVDSTCQHAKVTFAHGAVNGAGSLTFFGDRSTLRAAILNLTLNAIEAAGQGGTVGVKAHADGELILIDVVDDGAGPPDELAEKLCEPFLSSKAEGVGLGLALAQQVAVEHGGRLSWQRVGDNTCFRLALPHNGSEMRVVR
jgi:signal transduction histidine kinase